MKVDPAVAPLRLQAVFGSSDAGSDAAICPACNATIKLLVRMGVRRPEPSHNRVFVDAMGVSGSSGPASPTVVPYPRSTERALRRLWPLSASAATTTGALKSSCFISNAQTVRAILLASATVTSMRVFLASMPSSHEPTGAPSLLACSTTALLPMMSSGRSARSPILEIAPSLGLPPVGACFGTSLSQAAKSRPFANVSAGGAIAAMAVAVIGPMRGCSSTVSRSHPITICDVHYGLLGCLDWLIS